MSIGDNFKIALPAISLGWIIALVILVLVIVLWAVGQLAPMDALLFGGLALARLL